VFAQSPFGTALYDLDGRVAAANPAYERHWGIRRADVPREYSLLTDPQLERAGLLPLIRRAYAGEYVALPPVRYDAATATGAAGRAVWTQGHCFPVRDESGAVTQLAITFIDVTSHVEAEHAVEVARQRLADIVERLPAPTAVVAGEALDFVAANDAFRQLVGGRSLVGQPFGEALPELAGRGYLALLERVRDTRQAARGEGVAARWDGDGRGEPSDGIVDFVYEPLPASHGYPAGVVIQVIDRTEQARMLSALETSELRHRLAIDAAQIGTWTWDVATDQTTFDDRVRDLFGFEGDEPWLWVDILAGRVHPDDRDAVTTALGAAADPAGDGRYDAEFRVVRPDGSERWARASGRMHFEGSGDERRPLRLIGTALDVTAEVRARREMEQSRERAARLQSLTAALAATYTPADVAEVVMAGGVAAAGAATGMLVLRDAERRDELVIVGQAGLSADVVRDYTRFSVTAPGAAAACVRSGEAYFLESPAAVLARFADASAALTSLGTHALATVPLTVGGETVGAMSFTFTEVRPFPPEDRAFFLALGRQCAQAIERARLFAAEHEARASAERAAERARRLQQLTARLNEAVSREQIADVILEGGIAAVGADAGSLALVHRDADGRYDRFDIIRTAGYAVEVTARYRTFPVERGRPLSDAVLQRETILIGSSEEWRARWPGVTEDLSALGFYAFAAIPIAAGDRALAALSFSFREPQVFDEAARTFLATLGEQCALALERARLHEAELRLVEQHAALLETIQDAFVAIDRELRYTYVNPRAEAVLRRPAAELLGRRIDDVFPGALDTPIGRAIQQALETRQGTQVEAFSPVAQLWIEARIYPAPDGLSLVLQDVSARRRAQDAASLVAEASRLLSASLDYEPTLRAVAEAAVPRLGDWCAVDVIRDPAARAWPPRIDRLAVVNRNPTKRALGAELTSRYPTDWSAETGMAAVLRDGTSMFVPRVTDEMLVAGARDADHLALLRALQFSSIIVVPLIARGLTIGALTLCMTESGRHYDEADLALVQDLTQRAAVAVDNARLYRDAERARAEAEAANRAKGEFLAVMSHELRTPLNAIGGYAELMEMGIRGPVTAQQREDLERIQRSQKHLLGLINEVLNYARLETGTVSYQLADIGVAGALAGVESLILPQVRAKALMLETRECDPVLAVRADAEKLRQVLLNLLSNAVKFTDSGGTITLGGRPHVGAGGRRQVEITVSDTGVGIPSDKLEAIFEPFVQIGRALNSPGEGTGLGLAISRDLARGMGGELMVESVVGDGSTFTLTLPRA
jgi:PAS domain S-box-containing protein